MQIQCHIHGCNSVSQCHFSIFYWSVLWSYLLYTQPNCYFNFVCSSLKFYSM